MKKAFLSAISFYQKFLSALKRNPTCKYYPTCSAYTYGAIENWGVFVGTGMGLYRFLRCNPFSKGGVDPVPKRKAKEIPKLRNLKLYPRANAKKNGAFYTTDRFHIEYRRTFRGV